MRLAEPRPPPPSGIDAAMLQAFVTPVTEQLDLLAAPRDPQAFDNVAARGGPAAAGGRLRELRLGDPRPAAPPPALDAWTCWPAATRCWWSPN